MLTSDMRLAMNQHDSGSVDEEASTPQAITAIFHVLLAGVSKMTEANVVLNIIDLVRTTTGRIMASTRYNQIMK